MARIVRPELQPVRAWVYGVCLSPGVDLPRFPELAAEDQDILMPLPTEASICGSETPFCGMTFEYVSSSPETSWYCSQIMSFALGNNPMHPEVYRLAYFLYCKLKVLRDTMVHIHSAADPREGGKRGIMPGDMVTKRTLRVPVCMDPTHPEAVTVQDCEVMVQDVASEPSEPEGEVSPTAWVPESFATAPEDPPGLAILDSGCTRTMHGSTWAQAFEERLCELGLAVHTIEKSQRFRGVGGLSQSTVTKIFPIGIKGVHGDLYSAEVEGSLPLLLSRPFMHELGAVLDLGANTVSFTGLGVTDLPLVKTAKGHIAVNLLDFDEGKLDEFDDGPPDFGHVHAIFAADSDVEQFPAPQTDEPSELTEWMQETCAEAEEREAGQWTNEGDVSEEFGYFSLTVNGDRQVLRKASSKKSKKLMTMSASVDAHDALNKHVLCGRSRPEHRPPYGKVWLKQVFALRAGVSVLCVTLGLAIGVPLDFAAAGWNATTSDGRRQLHRDLRSEDPYLLVITPPCMSDGSWDIFSLVGSRQAALTPAKLSEVQGKILELFNKLVKERVGSRRHVLLELPSAGWHDHPAMKDVVAMISSGELELLVRSGTSLLTSMVTAASVFGDSQHNGGFDKAACDAMVQQAAVEQHVFEGATAAKEAFPAEVPPEGPQGGNKRRRRAGRQSVLVPQYEAPPVYLRPGALPQRAEGDERTLGELAGLEPEEQDDAGERARQTEQLEPEQADRRRRWLDVEPRLRKVLRDLHVQFGHPTNTTLQRILRRQGAKLEAIKAAEHLSCDACGESIRRRRPKPVRLPGKYEFNYHLSLDVFYAKDAEMALYSFLNIVCEATGFQVVSCLGQSQGPPSTKAVLRHFLTSWSSWAGLPSSIQVDRGKEYLAAFADYLKQYGVEQETMPLEAPWKQGRVEKAGGLWKEVFQKAVHEMQLVGLDDVILATTIVTQCRNSFPRTSGYALNQWVLGRPEIRLPGSLLQDSEREKLEVLEGAESSDSAMARSLGIREAARVAQVRMDTDGRVRRALLHQSTPTRGPFPVGSYVYFYRAQAPPGASRLYRWHGPARVIGVELRNHRRAEDPELSTDGGQPHSYWLRYGAAVVLVTGEQLRFASEDELLAAHAIPQEALEPPYARGARNYVDLRNQAMGGDAPAPSEEPSPLPPPGSAPVLLPGTNLPVVRPLLPPVPEVPDDGGLLDELGATVPRDAQQDQRTGGATASDIGGAQDQTSAGATVHRDSEQDQRTGGALPFSSTAVIRRPSVHEPEPQPIVTTPMATPVVDVPMAPSDPVFGEPQIPILAPSPSGAPMTMGYAPVRPERGPAERPYFTEDIPHEWYCPTLPEHVREYNLKKFAEALGDEQDESDPETDDCYDNPADVFLTGKAVRSEIKLKDLGQEDRAKFDEAMAKEWSSWQKFGAVETLTPQQIAALPPTTKIVGTRWVHTDKNQKPRLLAGHISKKTGKSKSQLEKEYPFMPKSRLVVQGCQEEDPGSIRSDSPTASLLAFNLLCAIAVMQKWVIAASDASTAYLQSQGINRLLILRPPRPPPPGVSPSDLFRAKGSIYGTKDAGRSWWKKLFQALRRQGWVMSKVEAALFFLFDAGALVGICLSHVDDLLSAGEGEKYEGTLAKLETELHLKVQRGKFRFCGKNLEQKERDIEVDQFDAIEGVDYLLLEKGRRKQPNSPLSEEEKSQFRGLIGQMGWIVRQSRPDLMVNVSMAAQTLGHPCVKDVVDLNKAVKMMKETADAKWCFRGSSLSLKECQVACFADSSWANLDGLKSQCGYVVCLTSPAILKGGLTPILILETYSGTIKRVCRSTLAAEANGFLTGVESAEYVRDLLLEITNPGVRLIDLDRHYLKRRILAFTDAKSLEATLNRDTGQPQDKRVRILVAQIKEILGENLYDDESSSAYAVWVDTSQMLADVLTKIGCEREPILEAMRTGQ